MDKRRLEFIVPTERSAELVIENLNEFLLKEDYKASYIVFDDIDVLENKLVKKYKVIVIKVD